MTERTPTPWRVGANSFGTQFIYGNPDQPRASPMGVVYNDLVAGGDDPGRLTEANAAFIVKAVNNHDALVKALVSISEPLKLDVDGIGLARTLNLINRMASLAKDALVDVQRPGDPVGQAGVQGERS